MLLIGVSMPRSGHHFAARLLQALYRDDLFYCERYHETDCCQAVPCALRGARPVTYQKSHDFDLDVPADIADATYLIQHRAPVPLLLSARERYARMQYTGAYGEAIGSDRGEYAVWLGRQAEYYAAFSRRWLASPPRNSVVLDYSALATDPAGFLARMVACVGSEVPPGRIEAAVAATIERAGTHGEESYVRRSIEERPFFDRELLAVCESLLFAQDPGRSSGRVFDVVPFEGTLIWHVFEARQRWRCGDLDGALEIVDRAITSFPPTGLLFHERALLLQGLGAFADARDALTQACALSPSHPQILTAQVDTALTLGDVTAARVAAEAFVALNPIEPPNQVVLALARAHRPDHPDDERCVATVRLLEDELIAREVAVWQGRRQQLAAEATLKELADAADRRLRDAEQAHAEAGRVREAYDRLSTQIEEKEQEIGGLRVTADERLRRLDEAEREIVDLWATTEERLRAVEEKEREIAGLRATADERLRAVDEKEREIADLRATADERLRLLDEKEREIAELTAVADERLQLIERLDDEARRASEALARLTGVERSDDHSAEHAAST